MCDSAFTSQSRCRRFLLGVVRKLRAAKVRTPLLICLLLIATLNPLSSYRRRYNVFYLEIQDELKRNRRWFVAKFELPERELIMQYLEGDVCTANAIVDLEIENHHPNLNRARKANYFYRTPTVPPIKQVDVAVGPDE